MVWGRSRKAVPRNTLLHSNDNVLLSASSTIPISSPTAICTEQTVKIYSKDWRHTYTNQQLGSRIPMTWGYFYIVQVAIYISNGLPGLVCLHLSGIVLIWISIWINLLVYMNRPMAKGLPTPWWCFRCMSRGRFRGEPWGPVFSP